jgi:hypothetical protein
MNRREFIAAFGGAAAWPLAAPAQQANRVRRIGVLTWGDETDPEVKRRLSAFTQALADLGWADGHNLLMDLRWHDDDTNRIRAVAQQLVGLKPDIILAMAKIPVDTRYAGIMGVFGTSQKWSFKKMGWGTTGEPVFLHFGHAQPALSRTASALRARPPIGLQRTPLWP